MPNRSLWFIDEILTGTTILGQSRPGNNDDEGALHILQSTKTIALLSDPLASYPGQSLGESKPSTKDQLEYSKTPTDKVGYASYMLA